jgi:hypothetical protein
MYGWWTSIQRLIIFFYMELAYTIRYGIMAYGLGMFVPWKVRALLGFSYFRWKTPENRNLR